MSDNIKTYNPRSHGNSFTKWAQFVKFADFIVTSDGSDECKECVQTGLNPLCCGAHPPQILTPNEQPITAEMTLNKDKKNKNIFWFNMARVKFTDSVSKKVKIAKEFVVKGHLTVSETPQFVSKDKWNIVAKIKLTQSNAMLVAFFNDLLSEKVIESIGYDPNNGYVFDNSISEDGVLFCKERYLKNTVLHILDEDKNAARSLISDKGSIMSLLNDYVAPKGFDPETNKARVFNGINNLLCQISLTPNLLSCSTVQYIIDKKPKTFTSVKVGFAVNWVRCSSMTTTTAFDENGAEIEVEVATLKIPNKKIKTEAEDADSDIDKIMKKKVKGLGKKEDKVAKMFFDDVSEESDDSNHSSDEESDSSSKTQKSKTKGKSLKKENFGSGSKHKKVCQGRPGKSSSKNKKYKEEESSEEEISIESESEDEPIVVKKNKKTKRSVDNEFFDEEPSGSRKSKSGSKSNK